MWALDYFTTLEGSRGDITEGSSHLLIPGNIPVVSMDIVDGTIRNTWTEPGHFNYGGSFMNPTYTFCTCHPAVDVDELSGRFGEFVIRILDPTAFGHSLHAALQKLVLPHERELSFLDGCAVRYDKGEIGKDPHLSDNRIRIHFAQKPPSFSEEAEYRFTAVLSGGRKGAPQWLDVELDLANGTLQVEKWTRDSSSPKQV